MRLVRDHVGGSLPAKAAGYPIAASTDVREGAVVKLDAAGKVVPVAANDTDAVLGVAEENHTGTRDATNLRNDGERILVLDSPSQIFEAAAPRTTATGGTATTVAAGNVASTFADDAFNGAVLKLVEKTAASANLDPLGTLYTVSGYAKATTTMTISAAGGAVTAGDVFEVYLPVGARKGGYTAERTGITLAEDAQIAARVVSYDTERGRVRYDFAKHLNANGI